MKFVMIKLLNFFQKRVAKPKRGIYGYPNDGADTLITALRDIWTIYIQNSAAGIEIDVQGMGASVNQYCIRTCVVKNGEIYWKEGGMMEKQNKVLVVKSLLEFETTFPVWLDQHMMRFSDTNDYCLAVYLCGPQ